MADVSKLKGRKAAWLGAPPPAEEAREDLTASSTPEISPEVSQAAPAATATQEATSAGLVAPIENPRRESTPIPAQPTARRVLSEQAVEAPRLDGRTMRRSGRTIQFSTKVSPEFDLRIRQIAMRDGLMLTEVMERALEAYESGR